jgi:cytochrome P450
VNTTLPPGPRMPVLLQTIATWSRPTALLERGRSRYGRRFTLRFLGQPPFVIISDPQELKELFQAPPEVLHPGEGARILEPVVGAHSVILLDEAPHLEQRKLLLPAFHGEKMQHLAGLMNELTEREVASWPRGEEIELHPRLQQLTLEIILRAVFGLEQGSQLDSLRDLLTKILAFSESPLSLLPPPPAWLGRIGGPTAKLEKFGNEVDRIIYELIDQRRAEDAHGEDVLAMLLAAEHEDGSPMSPQELRDELMTALVAGHETTASQLAWAFERLSHEPRVLARLQAEIDRDGSPSGDSAEGDSPSEDAYLTATIHEIMRLRPVLPNAEPRLTKQPVEIGGVLYPPGVSLIASAYLVHTDPDIYPQPYVFKPERFLEEAPGTYTWIPFGGGRRRCIGASFAMLEMKIAIRTVLTRCELAPVGDRPEKTRRRSITISPANQARVVLHERARSANGAEEVLAGASAAL